MRQLEACSYVQVTLETGFRRLARIDNRVRSSATLDVEASRAVTRLTADVLCVFSFRHQPRVRRCAEIAHYIFVARFAFLGTDEFSPRNTWRRENGPVCRAARKQNHGERGCSPDAPQNFLARTVRPSS